MSVETDTSTPGSTSVVTPSSESDTMDFPIIRSAKAKKPHAEYEISSVSNGFSYRRPHTPEKEIANGPNWVVQKFGGTSVGKVAVRIAEDIVLAGLHSHRIAVVCSARSTYTKSEGTTNRLLRAARDTQDLKARNALSEQDVGKKYVDIVETIRLDHITAGQNDIGDAAILEKYTKWVNDECVMLLRILESATFLQELTPLTKDMVMSVGEKLACLYMTALLQSRGAKATYVDMSDVITFACKSVDEDGFYPKLTAALAEKVSGLGEGVVPVITGYFGKVPQGLLEQIGRGYTDLCAALVAVGLRAKELQIWKEVDGIFTADPRKVPTARLLDSVTPSEAAELTFYGSEVIHPFTMDQVIRAAIPIRIKNVMNPRNAGTVILPDAADALSSKRPSGVFRNRSVSSLLKHSMPRRPTAVTIKKSITVLNIHSKKRTRAHGFLMSIFAILDRHGLSVDLISTSEVHVSMALHSEISLLSGGGEDELRIESASLAGAVEALSKWGDVDLVPGMAIISLVGRQLRSMVGISGRFFSTLGEHGINIEMISQGASEINISCVIEERDANRALNVVHTNLFTFLD